MRDTKLRHAPVVYSFLIIGIFGADVKSFAFNHAGKMRGGRFAVGGGVWYN